MFRCSSAAVVVADPAYRLTGSRDARCERRVHSASAPMMEGDVRFWLMPRPCLAGDGHDFFASEGGSPKARYQKLCLFCDI